MSAMQFELRRLTDYSDDSLIAEIKRVARLVNEPTLSMTEFRKRSRVSPTTIARRFGSWKEALSVAGCVNRIDSRNVSVPRDEVIAELQRVSKYLDGSPFGRREFNTHARFTDHAVRKAFGSWHRGMHAAGLSTQKLGKRYDDNECFENLLLVWTHYGRAPMHREMSKHPSKVGPKAYVLRFGTWSKALQAFVDRINADNAEDEPAHPAASESQLFPLRSGRIAGGDKRDIKLGLRYSVLKRDSFRCVICGRSPATHIGVILHVDHIVPWTKGGKTTLENLRSLCEDCNLGKGSKHEDTD